MENIEVVAENGRLSLTYEKKATEGWQSISPESFCATMYKVVCPPPNQKK
jgi:hypothetical protein